MRIALLAGVAGCSALGIIAAAGLASRASGVAPSTTAVPRQVELTIYNQDFALVREGRPVELAVGANRLAFADVSKELDPHSVLLKWEGAEQSGMPQIVGSSYDLGVRNSQELLRQEVGRPVELIRYGANGQEASREHGRLLVAEAGQPAVVEINGKLYVNPHGTLVAGPEDGITTIPQLTVQVQSPTARPASMELAYLTRGLSWSADYVATLPPGAADRLDLECYATVTNRTGVRYPSAAVTLVAGAPNRAARRAEYETRGYFADGRARAGSMGGLPQASRPEWSQVSAPETLADLHAYPLKNPATVQNEQLNRLLMLRRDGVRVKKDYSYRAPYLEGYSSPQQDHGTVTVGMSFANTAQDAVGAPLPQGTLRVYDPDRAGRLRYAGAAALSSTPTGGKVHFSLSNAFDLTTTYRTVSSRRIGKHKMRKQVEVRLENARPEGAPIRVVQGFYGGWRVVSESAPHVKTDGSTAEWTVPVPANGKAQLRYAVDVGY